MNKEKTELKVSEKCACGGELEVIDIKSIGGFIDVMDIVKTKCKKCGNIKESV